MATIVTWLGCDLVTGKIIEELPDLSPQGPLSHRLAAYTSTGFTLPIPLGGYGQAATNWLGATQQGRGMIVAVLSGRPVWAGIVLGREGGTDAVLSLACVTLEGYLDRRYVGTHTYVQVDEASVIATGLIGDANTTEGIGFTVDAPATGTLRDRTYLDQDDKQVYEAMRELSGVISGPEWAVLLDWTDATETAVKKTIQVKKRIGFLSEPPTPAKPLGTVPAVFSTLGESATRYSFLEDYSSGRGSNHIIAVSSGEGAERPQSDPARDTDLFAAGWPRYEHRFTPSTSIINKSTLDEHAANALTYMGRGARLLTITARADAYPMLGTHWATGDDVGFELVGHRHPDGLVGVARAVGWDLDVLKGEVTPILYAPDAEGT